MLDRDSLKAAIPHALRHLTLDWPHSRSSGKVRESLQLPDGRTRSGGRTHSGGRLLVTTDRLSAFDVVLAALPYKGQVLNQLSAFWFEHLADVMPSHLLEVPDPNVSLVQECQALPVEVIVRGYITGSTKTALWTLYDAANRAGGSPAKIYGHTFPDGLQKNDPLPTPIITPTTKAGPGEHDERLTVTEVVDRGFLDARTWDIVQDAALAIFQRGQTIAESAGFCLVDTKYEFGRGPDGTLMLIDEVHTPDSSRFWKADTMADPQPDQWDKEYIRLWYASQGYRGEGPQPPLPEEVIIEAAQRYITLYEGLTGQPFEPADYPAEPRIAAAVRTYLD